MLFQSVPSVPRRVSQVSQSECPECPTSKLRDKVLWFGARKALHVYQKYRAFASRPKILFPLWIETFPAQIPTDFGAQFKNLIHYTQNPGKYSVDPDGLKPGQENGKTRVKHSSFLLVFAQFPTFGFNFHNFAAFLGSR